MKENAQAMAENGIRTFISKDSGVPEKIASSQEVEAFVARSSLSEKEALVFFAIKANAMDLAARRCQVMCSGLNDQASEVFFKIKSIAQRHRLQTQ